MGPRTLTRYILKELIIPFVFGVCAFSGILLALNFINLLQLGEKSGWDMMTSVRLLCYLIPEKLAISIPMSTLLATLLALSGLSGHSETTAMRAGGVSVLRLAAPILFVGFLVSVGNFYLNESITPGAEAAFAAEREKATAKNKDVVINDYLYAEQESKDTRRVVAAETFNPATGVMTNVAVTEYTHRQIIRTIVADTLVWFDEGWYFKNGQILNNHNNKIYPLTFKTGYIPSGIKASPKEMVEASKEPSQMSFWELERYIHKTKMSSKDRRKLLVDLNLKLSMPFASFFFTLLGAPLGLKPQRRSVSMGFGLSIIFLLAYYALLAAGSMLGRGAIPPVLGAWLQNIVLGGYGVYQFIKVKK